jgi:hypothetical protein
MSHVSIALFLALFPLAVSAQVPQAGPKAADTADLPAVNRHVLAFVDAHLGKRVGRGQCWDLAAAALEAAHANWDGQYRFGTPVDPATEDVMPGDIIQFEGIETEYVSPNGRFNQRMPHHTAIVHAVHGKGRYTLAHQNFGRAGRKVSLTELETDHIVKGTYTVYRPFR